MTPGGGEREAAAPGTGEVAASGAAEGPGTPTRDGGVRVPERIAPRDDGVRAPERIAPGSALGDYLDRTRTYGAGRFVLEMSALALLLRIPAVVLAVQLGVTEDATTAVQLLSELGVGWLAFLALAFAPVVETLVFQWWPIAVVRRLGGGAAFAAVASATLFALLHYQSGAAAVLVHVPTGLVLAWCFLAWRHRGLSRALLMTMAVHFTLNLLALGAALASRSGGGIA